MEMLEEGGEAAISCDETEVGFYDSDGIGLADVNGNCCPVTRNIGGIASDHRS